MAIRTVVTRGFGNGTFSGTIALVVRRGYLTKALFVSKFIPIKALANIILSKAANVSVTGPADVPIPASSNIGV